MKNQTVIFFVRHGQTDFPHVTSQADDLARSLTDLGKRQIKKVGEYLKDFNPSIIFTSPASRCIESGKIIADICKVEVKKDDRLAEAFVLADEPKRGELMTDFVRDTAKKHAGEFVIAVTHQIDLLKIMNDEIMPTDLTPASICRVTMAGDEIVQRQMLYVAKDEV